MQAEIGIKPKEIDSVAKLLCNVLADEFVLYVKTLNAHWNVEGMDFHSKHLFFEKQYEELAELVDTVAERIRTFGHYAPATLGSFLELTHLTEQSRQPNNSAGFITSLLEDHQDLSVTLRGYISQLTDELNDAGTADFVTGLLETHEKMAWMLRAHLGGR
jgi:starvation-inducible DNA-binding protein